MYDAEIGNHQLNFNTFSERMLFDTGTSYIYIPFATYNQIITQIVENRHCTYDSAVDIWSCPCPTSSADDYLKLKFQIGNFLTKYWLQLRSEQYMWFNSKTERCEILIRPEYDLDHWLMGDPFFLAYYTIYDLESKSPRIGFVGEASSAATMDGQVRHNMDITQLNYKDMFAI